LKEEVPENEMNSSTNKRPWYKRVFRVFGWIILVIIILLTILILFIRSPWGQNIIVGEVTNFISQKTNTKVSIKKLFISFTGDIDLQGLYLEDTKGDTLIYSEKLLVEIPIIPIIKGNPIAVDGLKWTGLRANVFRKDTLAGYNFQFLIDAFASDKPKKIDTTKSEPPKISIGTIDFSDFKLNFDDEVTGMKANLVLGKLHLKGKNIDLKKMDFEVAKISLENTNVTYIQRKKSPPSDSTESVLPYLTLKNLSLKNVIVHYQSDPDSLFADLNVADLELKDAKADLRMKDIQLDKFTLNNSNIQLKMKGNKNIDTKPLENTTNPKEIKPFIWPEWNVNATSIALKNNHIHFQQGEKPTENTGFNAKYIVLNDFNFVAKDLELSKKESAKLQIKEVSFYESTGIKLKQLAFSAALNSTEISVDDLILKTNNSSINTDVNAKFASIQKFIAKPEESFLSLDLKKFVVDMNDAFAFQPKLRNNEYVSKLAKHKFSGKIKAKGKLDKIDLTEFLVNWGENTSITTHGELLNLTNFDNFAANIDNFTVNSTRTDINNFVSEKDLGISLPSTVLLQTTFSGKLADLQAKVLLTTPDGKVKIDGNFKQQNEIAFNANVQVFDLKLGKILNNPNIGTVALEMKASGNGNNINDLNAELTSTFSKLEFSGYDFSALKLNGILNDGNGNITLKYQDKNLDLLVDSKIQLDSVVPKIDVDIQLEGADLYALGLTEKEIRAKLMLNASFKGNAEEFEIETHITEGVAVYDEESYQLGPFDLYASATTDSTSMDISSNFLNGKLRANSSIEATRHAIEHHLEGYFSEYVEHKDSVSKPVLLQFDLKLAQTKIITDFLVPDIRTMDTLNIHVAFNQQAQTLSAGLSLPYIDYAAKTIDSLQVYLTSTESEAKFRFGFNELDAQPFVMNRTFLDGDLKNGLLKLNFNAFDGEKEMYVVQSEVSGNVDDLKIHFNPEKLIFNNESWSVTNDNLIRFKDKKITANKVIFSKNEESITIANDLMGPSKNNIGIGFENFKLSNLLALFNKDDLLASGYFQGNIVAVDPLGNFGLNADFSIDELTALKAPFGKLELKAKSNDIGTYNLNLDIKGEDVDVSVKGDYSKQRVGSELDFKVDLNKIGMKTISIISNDNLKDASGNISAKIALHGDITAPKYEGELNFNDAIFNVTQLNSKFKLANDKIVIDNKLITLNQFSIEDEQNNAFTLDGTILTESFTDPQFDMRFKGKNFQALNSTSKDNDLYYGKVNFDMDGKIEGKLSFPVVNVDLELNENTNFTYVIPESQAKLEKRDGIVEFVNKEDPNNILTRNTDTVVANLSGIELYAKLKIDKGAEFNVIIDPSTGDNLNVSGIADLDFNISKSGRMNLTGRYDIMDGHYELSLYNLVKRKFELEKGSSIVWRGDPLDAELNVTAKYEVDASASGLMSSQIAGASEELQNKYRQQLPFQVFLNVKGELDKPQLEFTLDMPEQARGSIDGTVYGRIKQLNSQEDELNKQVFSLLVLKKFYPNGGSDGSEGGAEQLVRKKVNEALSDQLNAFSNKLLGKSGVELDFGLNSYTDYQGESAQQRTDLNVSAQKKLFDDRLIVQVGTNVNVEGGTSPGEENSVLGNASIQYLLTEDGRWRLTGFRKNEYENVIDGQVYVNGISVIFQRQFNKWKELRFAPPKDTESEKESKKDTEKDFEKDTEKDAEKDAEKDVENKIAESKSETAKITNK
jgi:translocation and assembly module TamB